MLLDTIIAYNYLWTAMVDNPLSDKTINFCLCIITPTPLTRGRRYIRILRHYAFAVTPSIIHFYMHAK